MHTHSLRYCRSQDYGKIDSEPIDFVCLTVSLVTPERARICFDSVPAETEKELDEKAFEVDLPDLGIDCSEEDCRVLDQVMRIWKDSLVAHSWEFLSQKAVLPF